MPKALIITLIAIVIIALGAMAFYITQRQEAKEVKEQPVGTIPEKPMVQPPEAPSVPEPEPTTEPEIDTSDWKVYRNEKYGFEIKYPEIWEVSEVASNLVHIGVPVLKIPHSASFGSIYLTVEPFMTAEKAWEEFRLRVMESEFWNKDLPTPELIKVGNQYKGIQKTSIGGYNTANFHFMGETHASFVAGRSIYNFSATFGIRSSKEGCQELFKMEKLVNSVLNNFRLVE